MTRKISIADLVDAKQQQRKIPALSCYDYTTASLAAQTGIEMILVGDSAAQVMLGFDSTLPAKMDFMVTITAAVNRAAPNLYLVADMPFLSYQISTADAIRNAGRFLTEAGARMVKIEASPASLDTITAVTEAGIPVMAHIGIKPQTINLLGRFRAEATTAEMALELIELADRMVAAGAKALLLEGTAAEVAEIVTARTDVPVIGCGSGPGCDGQILIAPDILGLTSGPLPKFAKKYAELGQQTTDALTAYADEIKKQKYPSDEYAYHMKSGQLERLKKILARDTVPE
jgi:3-methyl-2-oxobutanoate hydroxymethyltransferase